MEFSQVEALPLGYYFDPKYEKFRASLVHQGAHYVGHRTMVSGKGDYHLLEERGNAAMLVNQGPQIALLSNVCRHRQALLIDPKNRPGDPSDPKNPGDKARGTLSGNDPTPLISCPVHRWAYDLDGQLVRTPNMQKPDSTCLPKKVLREWNGYLFDTPFDIAASMHHLGHSGLFDPALLDMSDYVYAGSDPLVHYDFSLELFQKVYFDLYHVAPYHPKTFASIVDCQKLMRAHPEQYWEFGERYNVQVVGWNTQLRNPKEGYYEARGLINDLYEGKPPPHGALWVTLFPGVMIEWYPHVTVVSTLTHKGLTGCTNRVDYFVKKVWADRIHEILPIASKAYNESAREDAEICQSMQDGMKGMWTYEDHAVGPRHPALEKGIDHYFAYIREEAARFGITL